MNAQSRWRDDERIDSVAFLAVLDVELAARADRELAGDDGLTALGLELEAAGVMQAGSLGRVVYRLRHETDTVAFKLVDAILTAIDRQDAVDDLAPIVATDDDYVDVDVELALADEPETSEIPVTKRGGWQRPDRWTFTSEQARRLHAMHVVQGYSLRAIARALCNQPRHAGRSPNGMLETLRATFKREGLVGRSQSAATAAANRARRQRPAGESKAAYKRRVRRERGYVDTRTGEWRIAGFVIGPADPTDTIPTRSDPDNPDPIREERPA